MEGYQVSYSWVPLATHSRATNSIELSGRLREAVNEHARVSFRYNNLGLPVVERCDAISSSEAMTNMDLSYLYGAVSELSSAMSVMLMAS